MGFSPSHFVLHRIMMSSYRTKTNNKMDG